MEKSNNQIKIKLTTIIALIIIVVIDIICIVSVMLNKDNNIKSSNKEENQIKQNEVEKKENKLNNEDTEFALSFLKMENEKENKIYSPLSIKYALHMLNDGANGNTKTQIGNVIGKTNLGKYSNINNVLSLANALYIRDTYSQYAKEEYKNELINRYNAEIKYDAFKNASNINNWIDNQTFGQIKNMLQDDVVTDPDNEMFLINALAIDMAWENEFSGENTHEDTFYIDNDNSMKATMMSKETKGNSISYYQNNNVTALAMDLKKYNNEQMQFIAIMPDENLSNYIDNFTTNDLENIVDNLTPASKTKYGLDISIPRFSFDYNLNLESDLMDMGITDAFNPELADFSNMSTKRPLWVGGALHKANIDFTEKGIKAAAVTVIYMTDGMILQDENKPIEIKIDKPFMYLIKDKTTNEIWFVGTVYQPNSWEDNKADYEYR